MRKNKKLMIFLTGLFLFCSVSCAGKDAASSKEDATLAEQTAAGEMNPNGEEELPVIEFPGQEEQENPGNTVKTEDAMVQAGASAQKGIENAEFPEELYLTETEEVSEAKETEEAKEDTETEDTGDVSGTEEEVRMDHTEGVFTSEPIPDEVFARMSGVSYPQGCPVSREDLRYLRLSYHDFSGQSRVGEMVCGKGIAQDLIEIFRELYQSGYQIDKMRLIDDYGGDDDLSCADNNTSCFNYRTVAGSTNLSKHALGVAVDVNPFYNPYVTYPNGVERISPPGSEPYANRSSEFPHKIGPGDACYEQFKKHGFTWGGDWKSLKDYQHFQKAK